MKNQQDAFAATLVLVVSFLILSGNVLAEVVSIKSEVSQKCHRPKDGENFECDYPSLVNVYKSNTIKEICALANNSTSFDIVFVQVDQSTVEVVIEAKANAKAMELSVSLKTSPDKIVNTTKFQQKSVSKGECVKNPFPKSQYIKILAIPHTEKTDVSFKIIPNP